MHKKRKEEREKGEQIAILKNLRERITLKPESHRSLKIKEEKCHGRPTCDILHSLGAGNQASAFRHQAV
jgi:hypothetical protein